LSGRRVFLIANGPSLAHTPEHIDRTIEAVAAAFQQIG
jgi:hypothetical protein